MKQRQRKLVGAVILVVFLTIYALAAMMAAIVLQVNATKLGELLFYVVGGLAWVIPAAYIIWWMERPDNPSTPE